MIQFKDIKNIKISLMKKKSEIDENNKSEYEIYSSGSFNIIEEFQNEDKFSQLVEAIYIDLINKNNVNETKDYLGIWIKLNDKKYENAISLQSLNDINKYGENNINAIYEFFKMTYKNENS